jgi:hypothetical protein
MARTHQVKAYRGQRKCQHAEEGAYSKCGLPLAEHRDDTNPAAAPLGHPFTQTALRCEACGQNIEIGDPYKWVAPRAHRATRGRKRNRHTGCPGWKPSELTSSQHLATVYAAQEQAEADLNAIEVPSDEDDADGFVEEVEGVVQAFGEAVREAADSYRESAQAIEEGFGHATYQSEELEGKADDIDSWADEAESYSSTVTASDLELTCANMCGMEEEAHDPDASDEDEANGDACKEWDPEGLDEWAEQVRDDALTLVQDSPV